MGGGRTETPVGWEGTPAVINTGKEELVLPEPRNQGQVEGAKPHPGCLAEATPGRRLLGGAGATERKAHCFWRGHPRPKEKETNTLASPFLLPYHFLPVASTG